MKLSEASKGMRVRVLGYEAGKGFVSRCTGLGVCIGDELTVLDSAPVHGPFLLEVASSATRVAMGRGMANKLVVEPV
jgi:Fe2+ transport system protein FeoA